MKKEDFSDVFLYTTIVDDDTVYVDKNVLHVHEGYNFMTADGRYVDAFLDNGSAIDIHGTFVIVDYDNDDIRLSGALLNGEPVLLIGNPELAEVTHEGKELYNFSVIHAQGEIRNYILCDFTPAITGDVFSLKQVAP